MSCCGRMSYEDLFAVDLPEFDGRSAYQFGQITPGGGIVQRSSDVVEVKKNGGGGTLFRDDEGNLKMLPLTVVGIGGAVGIGLLIRSMRGG